MLDVGAPLYFTPPPDTDTPPMYVAEGSAVATNIDALPSGAKLAVVTRLGTRPARFSVSGALGDTDLSVYRWTGSDWTLVSASTDAGHGNVNVAAPTEGWYAAVVTLTAAGSAWAGTPLLVMVEPGTGPGSGGGGAPAGGFADTFERTSLGGDWGALALGQTPGYTPEIRAGRLRLGVPPLTEFFASSTVARDKFSASRAVLSLEAFGGAGGNYSVTFTTTGRNVLTPTVWLSVLFVGGSQTWGVRISQSSVFVGRYEAQTGQITTDAQSAQHLADITDTVTWTITVNRAANTLTVQRGTYTVLTYTLTTNFAYNAGSQLAFEAWRTMVPENSTDDYPYVEGAWFIHDVTVTPL